MRWLFFLYPALFVFSIVTTGLAILQLTEFGPFLPVGIAPSPSEKLLYSLGSGSLVAAPVGWVGFFSLWIWRGRTKSRWTQLGYDQNAFQLMTRMRGAATRLRMLETLETPMDRLQLAEKLGLDWKAIDRQTDVLCKYGLIREQTAYGRVKMYSLTENGRVILKLVKELGEQQ